MPEKLSVEFLPIISTKPRPIGRTKTRVNALPADCLQSPLPLAIEPCGPSASLLRTKRSFGRVCRTAALIQTYPSKTKKPT